MIILERMIKDIEQLAEYTSKKPGVTRLSFTKEEVDAKKYVRKIAENHQLQVREDAIGNLFVKYPCFDEAAKTLLIGSHLDSVVSGGKYDGVLGVVIGLELLRHFSESKVALPFHVEVVSFTDEEGARFGTGMIGSRVFVGQFSDAELDFIDHTGETLRTVRDRVMGASLDFDTIRVNTDQLIGYIEVHIEQGKVLAEKYLPVGVVSGIVGLNWYEIEMVGQAGHAGTKPMKDRHDPVMAQSYFLLKLNEAVRRYEHAVVTCGQVQVVPGSINVIPEKVTFSIDLRDLDETVLNLLEEEIERLMIDVREKYGVKVTMTKLESQAPVNMDVDFLQLLCDAVVEHQYTPHVLPSGAGHDAMLLAQVTKTALMFVRTPNGESHRPDEYVFDEDIKVTADILLTAVLNMAAR